MHVLQDILLKKILFKKNTRFLYRYHSKCKINFSSLRLISVPIIYQSYKNEDRVYSFKHSKYHRKELLHQLQEYLRPVSLLIKKKEKNEISLEIFVVASRHPCRAEKNHFFTFSVTLPQIPKKSSAYPLYRNKRITNLGSDKKSNQLKKPNILPILHSYETS